MLKFISIISLSLAIYTIASASSNTATAWEGKGFMIKDSRCYVGIAKVMLSISELTSKDGFLVGNYVLDVPLMKSKSDKGRIRIPLEQTFNELREHGGTLKGNAYSNTVAGKVNRIVCVIVPEENQAIRLTITTDDRTIKFKSTYAVIEKTDNDKS